RRVRELHRPRRPSLRRAQRRTADRAPRAGRRAADRLLRRRRDRTAPPVRLYRGADGVCDRRLSFLPRLRLQAAFWVLTPRECRGRLLVRPVPSAGSSRAAIAAPGHPEAWPAPVEAPARA